MLENDKLRRVFACVRLARAKLIPTRGMCELLGANHKMAYQQVIVHVSLEVSLSFSAVSLERQLELGPPIQGTVLEPWTIHDTRRAIVCFCFLVSLLALHILILRY